jgi:hypothetical protein
MTQPSWKLEDCALSDLGELRHRFARGALSRSGHPVLLVRLEGTADRDVDGIFDHASAIVMAGLEAWGPWALILDLRALAYSWGDRMQNVLGAAQRWYEPLRALRRAFGGEAVGNDFPLAVVVSDLNREGLISLVRDEMHLDPGALLFESVDEAAAALDRQLEGVIPV